MRVETDADIRPGRKGGPRGIARRFNLFEAQALHASGMSYRAIGRALGVDGESVRIALSPEAYRRKLEQLRPLKRAYYHRRKAAR